MELNRSSFSQYACFTTCRKKYYWNYVENLVPKEEGKALVTGRLFHLGAAGEGTPEQQQTTWWQIGKIAKDYWGLRGKPEVSKVFDLGPVQVKFIADGIEDEYLVEYKTTSDATPENVIAQAMSLQLRLGCALFGKKQSKLRLVKKPQIRLKKSESEHEFEQRYLDCFRLTPEQYLLEVVIPTNTDGAVNEFLYVNEEIHRCRKAMIWPMAVPYICKGKIACQYMPLCADYETNIALFKQKEKDHESEEE